MSKQINLNSRATVLLTLLLLTFSGACKPRGLDSSSLTDADGTQYVVDESLGSKIASSALRGNQGYSSSACYQFVWNALKRVLGQKIDSTSIPARSAYQFGDWMDRNPSLALKVFNMKKLNVTGNDIPRGSVIVYSAGQCGASAMHGHIEIAVGAGKACSDYCAAIRSCNPRVYAPVQPARNEITDSSVADDSDSGFNTVDDSSSVKSNIESPSTSFEIETSGSNSNYSQYGYAAKPTLVKPTVVKNTATGGSKDQLLSSWTSPDIKPLMNLTKPDTRARLKEAYSIIKLYKAIQN